MTWISGLHSRLTRGVRPRLEGKQRTLHYSILAQRIPWTEEPGGLQPMESQRVGHQDWRRPDPGWHGRLGAEGLSPFPSPPSRPGVVPEQVSSEGAPNPAASSSLLIRRQRCRGRWSSAPTLPRASLSAGGSSLGAGGLGLRRWQLCRLPPVLGQRAPDFAEEIPTRILASPERTLNSI